jgi:hypothetical protein
MMNAEDMAISIGVLVVSVVGFDGKGVVRRSMNALILQWSKCRVV